MAEHSTIEWTDATWNPVTGCSVVSPGCTNCYAMRLAGTRLGNHPSRAGLTRQSKTGPVWTGEVRLNEGWLDQPLRWRRQRRIFVCAHGDLFHEAVPDAWIDQVFAVMALAPQHSFQVLTKRAARMRAYLTQMAPGYTDEIAGEVPEQTRRDRIIDAGWEIVLEEPWWQDSRFFGEHQEPLHNKHSWPLPNVWLGVSAEDQRRVDERIPELLATPAAVRFVSLEPLLGAIDLTRVRHQLAGESFKIGSVLEGDDGFGLNAPRNRLDWVIVGGESGPGARPMHPDWARGLRDQCAAAGVPFFFKQWGSWLDADQLFDRIESGPSYIRLGGERWQPPRPLSYGAAEILARTIGRGFQHNSDGTTSLRMDKHAAGRLLDGVEHDGMPGAPEPHGREVLGSSPRMTGAGDGDAGGAAGAGGPA